MKIFTDFPVTQPKASEDFRDTLEERARRYGATPALVEGRDGTCLSYQDLPETLNRRAMKWRRTVGTKMRGISVRRVDDPWESALDLLAAAWMGATILPISGRWPSGRLLEFSRIFGLDLSKTSEAWWTGALDPAPRGLGGTLLATSGSTGEPKWVHHSWPAHWANASGAATVLPLGPGDAWGIDLPLWHTSGWAAVWRSLHGGAAAVFSANLADAPPPNRRGPAITHVSMVATQLKRLLAVENSGLFAGRENWRAVLVGGGPVAGALREQALSAGWPLHVTYGMTETASQICTTPRLQKAWPEVSGAALPRREVRSAVDGEILVRGDVLATGYWHPQTGWHIPWQESGWLATGDLGEWVEGADGGWRITGRKDRRFISAGENLHPERIEGVLLGLSGVRRAVVVPRADPEYGNRPVVFLEGKGSVAAWREQAREVLTGLEMPVAWLQWPQEASAEVKPSLDFFRQVLARAQQDGYALPEHA